jgi:nucleoside-diphosphate-sugar epimerase
VTAVMRRLDAAPPLFQAAARDGRLRIRRASLTDAAALRRALDGVATVLHLATGGGTTWEDYERAMVQGTLGAAEAALEVGQTGPGSGGVRFLFVSSTAALFLGRRAGEELADDVDPDARPEKRAPYARGKIMAEHGLQRLARERGLRLSIVRPAIVIGAGSALQHGGLGLWVRDNHCVGWGRGERPLPLVLVEDVADALARLCAFSGRELDGKRFQLSSDVRIGAAELVVEIARRSGRDIHFHARPLAWSKAIEAAKWLVKRAGGRREPLPSFHDMESRALHPRLRCRTAREVLGWQPCDDTGELLERFLGPRRPGDAGAAAKA